MAYWLMKSEPEVFGLEDLRKKKVSGWDGVRNYQARNFMKAMKKGDRAFFYHSSCEVPGVVGIMEVAKEAYPDPTQFDKKSDYFEARSTPDNPVWFQVDVKFGQAFAKPVSLDELRGMPELEGMVLLRRGSRLSVQPVTARQWNAITKIGCQV